MYFQSTHTSSIRGQHSAPELGGVSTGQDPPSPPLPAKDMSASLLLPQQHPNGQEHSSSDLMQFSNMSRFAGKAHQHGDQDLSTQTKHSVSSYRFLNQYKLTESCPYFAITIWHSVLWEMPILFQITKESASEVTCLMTTIPTYLF